MNISPAQFYELEMQNRQNQQAQQQQNQQNIMQGLNDIAGVYMEQENMKSSVKAGNNLLKVLGPGIGMTEEMLKEMDLANKPMREQYAFQQGIFGNYAVASQARNFGQTQQAQQGKPFLDAAITNLNNTAAGNVPFTPPASQDPANTVPLPTGPDAVVAPPSGGTGRSPLIADMNDADYARYRQDVIDRTGRDPGPR